MAEIFNYVEKHTGKKALLHENGDAAPLNGVPSFSMDTTKATQSGFEFNDIADWVYPLVDFWIK